VDDLRVRHALGLLVGEVARELLVDALVQQSDLGRLRDDVANGVDDDGVELLEEEEQTTTKRLRVDRLERA
jgi:hypothetical protein